MQEHLQTTRQHLALDGCVLESLPACAPDGLCLLKTAVAAQELALLPWYQDLLYCRTVYDPVYSFHDWALHTQLQGQVMS